MRLILCGGGSGEKTETINKIFRRIIDIKKPLLYIPLAMNKERYDDCFNWITNEMKNIQIYNIDMVTSSEELFNKNLYDYSAIFIGGGNSFKLLKELKDSGNFERIQNYIKNDGVVYGGSAGAIIFGYDIKSCISMDGNDVNLVDTLGFDVLNGKSLFAHYTNDKRKLTEEQNKERFVKFTNSMLNFSSMVGPVIALPEEDSIIIDGDVIEMIGTKSYYEFESGKITKIDIEQKDNIKIK